MKQTHYFSFVSLSVFFLFLLVPSGTTQGKDKNLVKNGNFEQRGKTLNGWTTPDNLTIFWERGGPSPGKCLHLDTDVYRKEWEAWKQKKDKSKPPKKTRTSGKKYDTVGGTCGVAVYTCPIAVEKESWYLVEYDIRGPGGEPFLYLKGYRKCDEELAKRSGKLLFFTPCPGGPAFSLVTRGTLGEGRKAPQPGDYLQTYRKRFISRFPAGNTGKNWYHFAGVAHLKKRYHVDSVLLELYAYWPAGDYYFDNVSMRKISEKEAKRISARRRKTVAPVAKSR